MIDIVTQIKYNINEHIEVINERFMGREIQT